MHHLLARATTSSCSDSTKQTRPKKCRMQAPGELINRGEPPSRRSRGCHFRPGASFNWKAAGVHRPLAPGAYKHRATAKSCAATCTSVSPYLLVRQLVMVVRLSVTASLQTAGQGRGDMGQGTLGSLKERVP